MRQLIVVGPRLIVPCSLCAYQASGVQPLNVANAASAHDRYVHGIGVEPERAQ